MDALIVAAPEDLLPLGQHPLVLRDGILDLARGQVSRGEAVPGWLQWMPEMPFEKMAQHSIDFWLQSEDLPRPENRITYEGDKIVLSLTETNEEAARRLPEIARIFMVSWP